jgi:4-amino-4-deoxy-L-arabinose transferase-like glycosyltransferase
MHLFHIQDKHDRVAFFIIALSILISTRLLFTPLTYANDSWREADDTSIAHHFLVNGFRLLYPQINWGGSGPGYVETEFPIYTFMVSLLYYVFGEHLWLGRLLSLGFATATLVFFYTLAKRNLGARVAMWSLAFFAASPLIIRYSVAYMPEAMVLCFYVAAITFFSYWLESQSVRWLMLTAVCTSLALLIKAPSVLIVLVFVLVAHNRYGFRPLRSWGVWIAGLIIGLPYIVWYLHAHHLYLQYGNTFGVASGGDTKWGDPSYWLSASFYLSTLKLELEWVLGGLAAIAFLVGLVSSLKTNQFPLLKFGVVSILLYYFIIARAAEKGYSIHYHIYAVPFVALGFGIGFDRLVHHARNRMFGQVIGLVSVTSFLAISTYAYATRFSVRSNEWAAMRIECARVLERIVPQDALIIVSSGVPSVEHRRPRNYQDPIVFSYSHRYGWSLPLDWHTPAKVDSLRHAGAKYFVIYNGLYLATPQLVDYLNVNAEEVDPGVPLAYTIFRFKELANHSPVGLGDGDNREN